MEGPAISPQRGHTQTPVVGPLFALTGPTAGPGRPLAPWRCQELNNTLLPFLPPCHSLSVRYSQDHVGDQEQLGGSVEAELLAAAAAAAGKGGGAAAATAVDPVQRLWFQVLQSYVGVLRCACMCMDGSVGSLAGSLYYF